jgi:GDP-D-mannose dehydratase
VFGTGVSITVEEFLLNAARAVGFGVPDQVHGNPGAEGWRLVDYRGTVLAQCDPEFFRPMDPNELCVEPEALERTRELIGWSPIVRGTHVVTKMVEDPETVTYYSVRRDRGKDDG